MDSQSFLKLKDLLPKFYTRIKVILQDSFCTFALPLKICKELQKETILPRLFKSWFYFSEKRFDSVEER